jgi:5-methylcytosine-specific restriction endonuclease McrA
MSENQSVTEKKSSLHDPVLVLNKAWSPILVKPVWDAISDLFQGTVKVLDDDYTLKSFKEWTDPESDRIQSLTTESKVVRTNRMLIPVPEIVVHTDYSGFPDLDLRWSRRNLELRDNNECQYCGVKVHGEEVTIDHIMPKARGGKNSWVNCVIACKPCNRKKADKTPEEAHMSLRGWVIQGDSGPEMTYKPFKPRWYPLTAKFNGRIPESWTRWIPSWALDSKPHAAPSHEDSPKPKGKKKVKV